MQHNFVEDFVSIVDENIIGGITASAGAPYSPHSGGCITCHMGSSSIHTFIPEDANCEPCHTDGHITERDAIAARIQAVGEALELLQKFLTIDKERNARS